MASRNMAPTLGSTRTRAMSRHIESPAQNEGGRWKLWSPGVERCTELLIFIMTFSSITCVTLITFTILNCPALNCSLDHLNAFLPSQAPGTVYILPLQHISQDLISICLHVCLHSYVGNFMRVGAASFHLDFLSTPRVPE